MAFPRNVVSALLAGGILCGCSTPPNLPGGPSAGSAQRRLSRSGSSGPLLYVSDWQRGEIFIFTYPDGSLVNTIADSQNPMGLCSDVSGNVWVTNYGASSNQIVEYAHGGTTPIATLDDPNEQPRGCSVNPKTGDLAVANGFPGNVVVYAHASGSPMAYAAQLSYPFSCTYDYLGNLFVDGYRLRTSDKFALSELRSGGSTFLRITIEATIGLPGNLQWDGSYLAVGGFPQSTTIDRLRVFKRVTTAKLQSTVTLTGPVSQPPRGVQFAIRGGKLVMPFGLLKNVTSVGLWKYPSGGTAISGIHHFGGIEVYGVAISALPDSSHPMLYP